MTENEQLFFGVSIKGGDLAAAVARAAAMYHQRLGYAADTVRMGPDHLAPDVAEIHGLQVEITTALSHPRREVWAYRQRGVSAATEA